MRSRSCALKPVDQPVTTPPLTVILRGDHVTLAQAVKIAGFAGSGGEAKHLVRDGGVFVNDVVVTQPGKKLHAQDRFRLGEGPEWTVAAPGTEEEV